MRGLQRALHYLERWKRRRDTAGRSLEDAYGKVSAHYFRDFWESAARAVGAESEDVGDVFLRIRRGDRWTFVQRHLVMLDSYTTRRLVENKALLQRLLAEHGSFSPQHLVFDCFDVARARRFIKDLGRSVVVKPVASSRGRGVTTRIETPHELALAAAWASCFDRSLIVEEHLEGDNFRLLFLDGKLIATVRREPPTICGDGIHTIRDLVRRENEQRLAGRPVTSVIPLFLDVEADFTLRRQGLSRRSVPARGQRVPLKSTINQNAARENHTVAEGVHPSLSALGRKFASAFRLELFGMDLITPDIGMPLNESGGAVVELNTQPGIHYHDLVSDQSTKVPVGELILEAILSGTSERWCR